MELVKGLSPDFKTNYLRAIASGHVESTALAFLEVDWIDFFEAMARDPEFRKEIDLAKEARGDRWVEKIAESLGHKYTFPSSEVDAKGDPIYLERPPTKDENARDKLHFEKLKFLAQADNPKKYGSASGKSNVNIDIDLTEFKLLTPQESIKVLNNDPFNKMVTIEVDAEVKESLLEK